MASYNGPLLNAQVIDLVMGLDHQKALPTFQHISLIMNRLETAYSRLLSHLQPSTFFHQRSLKDDLTAYTSYIRCDCI